MVNLFGVQKVHGVTAAGEFLTGDMDFFTVRSLVDISPSGIGDPADASQLNLDKLIETVSTRTQPVIIGNVSTESSPNYDDFVGFSSGTVWVLKFATEHTEAWGPLTGTVVDELNDALDGIEDFIFGNTNNVIVNQVTNL